MGTITAGIGLISGIDTATLIDSLIALESRGKLSLQARIASLQAQKSALLDINARLLNLKNAGRSFRLDSIFQSALATTSDSSILTATASSSAQPGTFTFIVKQLVATSQMLSAGFADSDTTPLALSSLSFEFGRGKLSTDAELANLNGGSGVRRGNIVITDSAGQSATIDLSTAVTMNEVLDAINNDTTVSVTAAVEGDHLVVTDTAGGAGTLTIADATGYYTATDLGIAGTAVGGTITGSDINSIGANTALSTLNDGNGVLILENVPDLFIRARDTVGFYVDFGRVDLPIDDDTLLADLNNGAGVTIDDDTDTPDIKFVTRANNPDYEFEVDLTGVTTIGGLKSRVFTETDGQIQITVHADGNRLTVTQLGGVAGELQVLGAGPNDTQTAEDLGILHETASGGGQASFDGEIIPNTIQDPTATTIQDVIDRINNAEGNEGRILASLGDDGVGLKLEDQTGQSASWLIVTSTVTTNPEAAANLGIETGAGGVGSSTLNGNRIIAGLNSVLVRSLNGGAGLGGDTSLTITDRNGGTDTFTLDENGSLGDIIDLINASSTIQITASLNAATNGLLITDTSGGAGNLTITGSASDDLGIAADVASDTVEGSNLQLQYVSNAAKLSDLNYGRGVGTGVFRITDGYGNLADVNIGSDSKTLYDVIQEINSRGIAVTARVNDNGDGLIIEHDPDNASPPETGNPFVAIKVVSLSGTTAADLSILGEADAVGESIDGSYERVVALDTSDSLDDVVSKVNDAGIPVSASVINTGSGATPFHINFTSNISGRLGDLIIDTGGVDLGLTSISRGRDAKVFFGSDDPAQAFLITSPSNSITGVVQGVTIDLVSASDSPVTVTVSRDTQAIIDAVSQLVTTFNDAIGRINDYDFFDVETEERGPLLGNATTARVRDALYRLVQGTAMGVETQYQRLSEVGVVVGTDGLLTFDQDKFSEAYDNDPVAVENLFAAYEVTTTTTQDIAPGVTVNVTEQTFTVLGFGDLFDQLLDGLTNSVDGTLTLADEAFQDQIDLANDRIEVFDERLAAKRTRLEREFAAMETALARLQAQNNALVSLTGNLTLAQNLFRLNAS